MTSGQNEGLVAGILVGFIGMAIGGVVAIKAIQDANYEIRMAQNGKFYAEYELQACRQAGVPTEEDILDGLGRILDEMGHSK